MKRITYIFFTIAGGLVALVVGELFFKLYRYSPALLHVSIVSLLTIAPGVFIIKKWKEKYTSMDLIEHMPTWLKNSGMYVMAFSLGALITSYGTHSINRTSFYLDNGGKEPISFKIKNMGEFQVNAGQYVELNLPLGKNTLIINNEEKEIDLNQKGYWVYNPGKLNTYFETSVLYGTDETAATDTDFRKINEEMFYSNADFIFEAPGEIVVDKNHSKTAVSRKLLLRVRRIE